MNQDNIKALKTAADLLKSGNTKDARPLIIQVLRDDPENLQAWYMLSFAVPRQDKQIDALLHLLKLDPTNEKAKSRLQKLGGALPEESEESDETTTPSEVTPHPVSQAKESDDEPVTSEATEDLLTQRLFGEATETNADDDITPTPSTRVTSNSFIDESDNTNADDETKNQLAKNKSQTKIFGLQRRTFILLMTALIFSGLAYMVISITNGNGSRLASSDTDTNEPSANQTTPTEFTDEESTLEATEIQATSTTAPPTPTVPPTTTPKPFAFTTEDLTQPDEDTRGEMLDIQDKISALMGLTRDYPVDSYSISQSRLESFLWEFDNLTEIQENAENYQTFLTMLGLAQPTDDYTTFYTNIWVDPNGTIYFPEDDLIAVLGFELSPHQKFSYTQAFVQHIRNTQKSFQELEIFPPCDLTQQACEVNTALVKGEAAVIASEWAKANLTAEELTKVENATKKLFFIYPVPSASTLMEEIRLFPYEAGFNFATAIYESGGIETLNQLYQSPPTTTEQILHPEKYLEGEEAVEVINTDISSSLPSGYQEIYSGSLGEWKTYLLLTYGVNTNTRIMAEDAADAAAGWGGDHFQIYSNESASQIMVGGWVFDTLLDTEQFYQRIENFAFKFVSGSDIEIAGLSCNSSTSQTTCVFLYDNHVIWLLGPDNETVEVIIQEYFSAE